MELAKNVGLVPVLVCPGDPLVDVAHQRVADGLEMLEPEAKPKDISRFAINGTPSIADRMRPLQRMLE